jgi:hypothetical protein
MTSRAETNTIAQAKLAASRQAHLRARRSRIILPFALGTLFVFGLPAVLALVLRPDQLGTVAAFMSLYTTILLALLCLLPYALLVLLSFGVALAYSRTRPLIRSAHRAVVQLKGSSRRALTSAAQPVIAFNAGYTRLERLLGLQRFSQTSQPPSEETEG